MKSVQGQRKHAAMKAYRTMSPKFKEVDLAAERAHPQKGQFVPSWMTRAFRNNQFTVMIFDGIKTSAGPAIRAMVQKHDDTPIKNHWMSMYRIKNEIFGPETIAIEYYPKESELTNDHNIYWMWIFPEGVIPKIL